MTNNSKPHKWFKRSTIFNKITPTNHTKPKTNNIERETRERGARGRQENLPATGEEASTNMKKFHQERKPEDRTEERRWRWPTRRRATYAEERTKKEKLKRGGENEGEDEATPQEEWTSDSYGRVTNHLYIKWVKGILALSHGVLGVPTKMLGAPSNPQMTNKSWAKASCTPCTIASWDLNPAPPKFLKISNYPFHIIPFQNRCLIIVKKNSFWNKCFIAVKNSFSFQNKCSIIVKNSFYLSE